MCSAICAACGELPEQTDQLFVVDARHVLKGSLPLPRLLLHAPGLPATAITESEVRPFRHERQRAAGGARVRALQPRLGAGRRRARQADRPPDGRRGHGLRPPEAEQRALERAGLRGEEDLFASVWDTAKNRGPWLFINLVTAFIASRVIGAFEGTIAQLVALAALMPIVASVGGNTGNQTIALVVRGLALDQVNGQNSRYLLMKELIVSLLNGLMWGGLMGLFAWAIYRSATLGS